MKLFLLRIQDINAYVKDGMDYCIEKEYKNRPTDESLEHLSSLDLFYELYEEDTENTDEPYFMIKDNQKYFEKKYHMEL